MPSTERKSHPARHAGNRGRAMTRLAVLLTVIAWSKGCGDGDNPTAPPPQEPVRPATVTINPATAELTALGATVQLTAEVRDQHARVMAGPTVTWSSGTVSVAAVDASGIVTAVAEGVATITASAGSASGSAVVTVKQAVASVEVRPAAETIGLGRTLQLTAVGFDESGNTVERADFSWESSDSAIATVDASGLVTGVAAGVVTITTSAGSGAGTAEITVVDLDRAALVALYDAMGGRNWADAENWLTDAPLADWYGVDTDDLGRVVRLDLSGRWDYEAGRMVVHGLSGSIPPELGSLVNLSTLNLGQNLLSGPIPPELGELTSLTALDLGYNHLRGPIPSALRSLIGLTSLHLAGNSLTGPVPSELGSFTGLESLTLTGNDLSGPIPESFLALDALDRFDFALNADLCVPGTDEFVSWLAGIEYTSGPYCNESDMEVLAGLYQAAGGRGWRNSTGWLETPALAGWHGVATDALGRVATLDLTDNGLEGRLTAGLGGLAEMTALRVGTNALSGPLPLSLSQLPLVELQYSDTGVCVPAEASFRTWLSGISSHEGTGMGCGPPSDREVLVALYEATDGPNWFRDGNWLTDAPLRDWYGVDTDPYGSVIALNLDSNNLSGPIPPELGDLTSLRRLYLVRNSLTGPIPPRLGDLINLEALSLAGNALTGPIPPELAGLTAVSVLSLYGNDLSGPIPHAFGNLTRMTWLELAGNDLSGPIPPELGALRTLEWLYLSGNDLTGPIPSELGSLSLLRGLDLASNDLTGRLPAELADASALRELLVANNPGLSGSLPTGLRNLGLETLLAGGTDLCAPSDPGFQVWLATVYRRRVVPCAGGHRSVAYLTQAVQSLDHPVPLVAGEQALLRVFVTATHPTTAGIPPVRARFYLNGTERHVTDIPATATAVPTEVVERSLSASSNAEIPGELIQPGLEMVIQIDPEDTLDPGLGVAKRIPETGRVAVEVREMPVLDLTVIPFLWNADPNREVVEAAEAMEEDPGGHTLLGDARTLLPISDIEVTAHGPVLSSSNNVFDLLNETWVISALEGGDGHYMGMMSRPVTGGFAGLGHIPGRVSVAIPNASIIAHELGHNMNLQHAACGGAAGPDQSFPYLNGSSGAWGFDVRDGGRLVSPEYKDLMSYCGPQWISDYHFTNALRFRLVDERPSSVASLNAQQAESVLLWGGADAEGEPFLNPAFVVDAPPALPDAAGEHRVTGRTASGDELFSLDFVMPEVADGDGSSSFVFVLPVEPSWAGNLASIRLSGPGGSITLDSDTDLPMTILLDPGTGEVRGILRDSPQADAAAALAPQAGPDGLDVLFSRGIPDAAAWDR